MPGLFEELDIAGANDDPWSMPEITYAAVVSDLEIKVNEKGNHGMYFKYKVTEGEYADREVQEYKRLPHPQDAEKLEGKKLADARSYIKQRLASLGIPEERMNTVSKDDIVGIECYISTKMNGNFVNIRQVSLTAGDDVSSGTTAVDSNPFMV